MAAVAQEISEKKGLDDHFRLNVKKLTRLLCILLPLWALVYNLKLESIFGLQILSGVYYGVFVATALFLVLLSYPLKKGGKTMGWYDFVLAISGVIPCLYFAWNYESIVLTGAGQATSFDVVMGTVFILVLLEAVRRTTGLFMVIIALFFIFHGLYANQFPSFFRAASVSYDRLIISAYQSGSGIFGMVMKVASTYLIAFATFGAFMVTLGAGEKFVNLALSLVGHVKGGAAKMALFACAAMGTLTGDPISNVGISGSFSMPLMKKTGFCSEMAAAVVAAGSVGGVIMPPMMGAIIFIMVELTGVTYAEVIKAAIFPALLYFYAIYCQIDFYSKRNNMVGLPKSELPDIKKSLNESKYIFVTFAVLVFFLVGIYLFPVRAAYYTLFVMVGLFIIDKYSTVTWRKMIEALEIATKTSLVVIPVAAGAGIILASISMTGWGVRMAANLVEVAGSSLFGLALMLAVASYIMGMGVSALLSYILLATLVAPALTNFGVPVVSAHFFIIYMGLSSFITPPYAVASLQSSSMIGADFYKTSWKSMKLCIVAYLVPFTILYEPILLLQNFSWGRFIPAIIGAVAAIYLISAGLEGYLHKRNLLWYERIVLVIGSVLLFIPLPVFLISGTVACLLAIALYAWNSRRMALQMSR